MHVDFVCQSDMAVEFMRHLYGVNTKNLSQVLHYLLSPFSMFLSKANMLLAHFDIEGVYIYIWFLNLTLLLSSLKVIDHLMGVLSLHGIALSLSENANL